jgi:L-rhamnose isomerase/sugar isomerase
MPGSVFEKLEDAAQAHKFTGIAPAVALHIPWDSTDNWHEHGEYANKLGISIGAINPNLFQDADYKFGSLCSSDSSVRKKAITHVSECIAIMRSTGSKTLSLWLGDGTNFPGQNDFRTRRKHLSQSLREIYAILDEDQTLLIEYKPFEPASYHTDIADWGSAYSLALQTGQRAKVLVDLGHHFHGANIEHIVAILLGESRLGGFHFNGRRYADDDLTSGSTNPYELFLIYVE